MRLHLLHAAPFRCSKGHSAWECDCPNGTWGRRYLTAHHDHFVSAVAFVATLALLAVLAVLRVGAS
jgi:hypothetical protein